MIATGAFNYLSGVNSLSTDGHTLMSVESPWGMKYTGGTSFDPALVKKGIIKLLYYSLEYETRFNPFKSISFRMFIFLGSFR